MRLVFVLALLLVSAAVYLPVADYGYVLYDDDVYVSENGHLSGGLTTAGATWALTASRGATWQPLVWSSYLADVSVCGMEPRCFHRTNLALHLANVALLFAVGMLLGGQALKSGVVASLFALHPIHVEAVAWISARKDVLSTCFFLLALVAYLRYVRKPGAGRYVASLIMFSLGLMAKPMLVTLPLLLLLLDYWPLGRFRRGAGEGFSLKRRSSTAVSLVIEKIPFLILSFLSSVITYTVQHRAAAVGDVAQFPPLFRIFNAALSYFSYLRKFIWPSDLATAYPMPMGISWLDGLSALAGFVLMTGLMLGARKRAPHLFVGWFWFVVALAPVIQLVPIGTHALADRFAYIPFVGLYVALAWLVGLPQRRAWRLAAVSAAAAMVILFATVTRRQITYWSDTRALFERALAVAPENWTAHNNLGVFLARSGDAAAAAHHFEAALRIRPDYQDARENLEKARRSLVGAGWR